MSAPPSSLRADATTDGTQSQARSTAMTLHRIKVSQKQAFDEAFGAQP